MRLFVTDSPQPFLFRRTVLVQGKEDVCLDLREVLDCAALPRQHRWVDLARGTIPRFLSLVCVQQSGSRDKIEQTLSLLVKGQKQKKNRIKIYDQRTLLLRKPIESGSKVIIVGCREPVCRILGGAAGKEITGFFKFASTLADPGAKIRLPRADGIFDADAVLGVVIGKRAERVPVSGALAYVAGFTLLVDITDRDVFQEECRTNNNLLAKNQRNLSPLGPCICMGTEGQLDRMIEVTLRLNGQVRQHFCLSDLLYKIEEMVSAWSRSILEPGDVIGMGATIASPRPGKIFESPIPIKPGDVLEVESPTIGVLKVEIVQAQQ